MPRPFFIVLARRWLLAGAAMLAAFLFLAYGAFPLAVLHPECLTQRRLFTMSC